MDFSEIENSVRITLDDNSAGDKLWSQGEILEYAQDAENEACERADLLVDETSAFTDISVDTSTAIYSISNTITNIKSAKLALGTKPLMKTSRKVLDLSFSNWPASTSTPRSYFLSATNKITVYPKPIIADTLNMAVARFPTAPMTVGGSPEIDARYHPSLLLWILYRCYMKNDSETLNVDKAMDYKAQFEEFFGPKKILPD
jgi:hypothetical protein